MYLDYLSTVLAPFPHLNSMSECREWLDLHLVAEVLKELLPESFRRPRYLNCILHGKHKCLRLNPHCSHREILLHHRRQLLGQKLLWLKISPPSWTQTVTLPRPLPRLPKFNGLEAWQDAEAILWVSPGIFN